MSAIWGWFLSTRVGRWIVGISAVVAAFGVAIGIALVEGFKKGRTEQATTDRANDTQSLADAAEQSVKASRDRTEVENENAKLPDAPAQKVADAAPDTAVGELRDDGWTH